MTPRTQQFLRAAALCVAAAVPASASAAGFSIYEQSPQGTALAGAMTARVDDASAIFYNPAGLGFLPGVSVVAGGTLVFAGAQATAADGTVYNANPGTFFLPTIYAAARVHDLVSVGLGAFASHGLGIDWNNPNQAAPFPGRFMAQRVSLQTFTLNPTVSVRPLKELSLGAGVDVVMGAVELQRYLALGQDEAKLSLSAGTTAVGANIGALAQLLNGRLSVGLSYRTVVGLNFDGGRIGFVAPAGVAAALPYTTGGAKISIPHTLAFGVAGLPTRWLRLSLDMTAMFWSDTRELRVVLSDPTGSLTQSSASPRDWRDAYAGRLGAEVDISQITTLPAKLVPKIRLGLGYDQTPVPATTIDASLPDNDRVLVSAGLSLGRRGLGSIEVGYMAVIAQSRASENPELRLTYATTAHVLSAGLTLQMDVLGGKGQPVGPLHMQPPMQVQQQQ